MTGPSPAKTIFPPSGRSKRLAVHGLRAYARTLRKPSAPFPGPGDAPVRILIQTMGGIGNSLMATPLIDATRAAYPQARIDVLTTPGAAQLLDGLSGIDRVIVDPSSAGGGYGAYWRANADLWAVHYDGWISALNAHLVLFGGRGIIARAKHRVMHEYDFETFDDFSMGFTQVVPRDWDRHDAECNVALIESLSGVPLEVGPMRVALAAGDASDCEPVQKGEDCIVGVCPGSSGWMSFKRWPLESYFQAIRELSAADSGLRFRVFLGPDELDEIQEWKTACSDLAIEIVAGLGLRAYAASVSRCSVVITNDSLPMHICSATQTPVVALFGPTHASRTGPWMVRSRILTAPVDFAPYYEVPYPLDPKQFPDCMALIAVGDVVEATLSLLGTDGA